MENNSQNIYVGGDNKGKIQQVQGSEKSKENWWQKPLFIKIVTIAGALLLLVAGYLLSVREQSNQKGSSTDSIQKGQIHQPSIK